MNKKEVVFFHGHHGLYHRPYHWVPTHLAFLSTLLVKEGFKVHILDENNYFYDDSVDRIIKNALFCGVSATTGNQIDRGIAFSKKVRKLRPDCKIIWGGPHVSALPHESLQEDYIDIVCTGRGEVSVLELARSLYIGKSIESVPGILYKDGEGGIHRSEVCPVPRFKGLPKLPYEIMDMKGYLNPETMVINYQTSLGCIGKCSFCYWYGKHPVDRNSLDNVFADIEKFVTKYDVTSIYIDDPDFFQGKKFVLDFLNKLEQSDIRFHWGACSRADILARFPLEVFEQAAKLGLQRIFVGQESGSPKILKKMMKGINTEEILTLAERLKDIKIELYLGIILGVPGETPHDLYLTGELLNRLRKIKREIGFQATIFTPYPGLPLTEELIELGFQRPKSLAEWSKLKRLPVDFAIPIWLKGKDREDYERIYNKYLSKPTSVTYMPAQSKLKA